MDVTIQCFGAFRAFGTQISVSVREGATPRELRDTLRAKLQQLDPSVNASELLASSRFATQTRILEENESLDQRATIVIIPPVSGG